MGGSIGGFVGYVVTNSGLLEYSYAVGVCGPYFSFPYE